MFKILFDSQPFQSTLITDHIDHNIISNTKNDQNNHFHPSSMLDFKITQNQSNNEIQEIVKTKELIFLENIFSEKDPCDCWVKFLNGKKYNIETVTRINSGYSMGIKFKDNEKKIIGINNKLSNSINCRFAHDFPIKLSKDLIKLGDLKELCQKKNVKLDLTLQFYAIISADPVKKTQNIQIRLKIREISIIQINDKILDFFHISNLNTNKNKNGYEYIQRYPSQKKNVINNVLNLLNNK